MRIPPRQFVRHWVWWFVGLVIIPSIVGFACVLTPSNSVNWLGVEILWEIFFLPFKVLGHPIVRPLSHVISTNDSPPLLILLFYPVVCLVLAAITVMLANHTIERDARKSSARPSL